MALMQDILDRVLGSGASTTLSGSGLGALLYSLSDKFFPKAAGVAAQAEADPLTFWVGVVLLVAGMIWHKPASPVPMDEEPQ